MPLQKFNNIKLKKKTELKLWHKLLFLSPILIIVLIFKGNEWYRNYKLSNNGIETTANISFVSLTGVRDQFDIENIAFTFNYHNSIITGYGIAETNNNYVLLPNGMPLMVNDEFKVKYVNDNPDIYKVDFSRPEISTIINYLKNTTDTLKKINNLINSNVQNINYFCLSKNIYYKFGIDGLATIIFYNENIVENFKHNSITFNKFISKKEFKELLKKCQ